MESPTPSPSGGEDCNGSNHRQVPQPDPLLSFPPSPHALRLRPSSFHQGLRGSSEHWRAILLHAVEESGLDPKLFFGILVY